VVKITRVKKVANPSKGVALVYVNHFLNIHRVRGLWKSLVDKLVDNVENSELSTGISSLSQSPGLQKNHEYRFA